MYLKRPAVCGTCTCNYRIAYSGARKIKLINQKTSTMSRFFDFVVFIFY